MGGLGKIISKIQHLKISYNYCWTQIGTTIIVTNNPTITLNRSFQNKVWDTQCTSILYVEPLLTWTEMIFFVFRGVGIEMFKFFDAPTTFPSCALKVPDGSQWCSQVPIYSPVPPHFIPYLYGDKLFSSDKEFPFSNGLQFSVQYMLVL